MQSPDSKQQKQEDKQSTDTKALPVVLQCHRLDFATSGIMCYGLDTAAAGAVSACFAARDACKLYVALVWGHMSASDHKNSGSSASGSGDRFFLDWPIADNPTCDHNFMQSQFPPCPHLSLEPRAHDFR